MVTYGNLRTTAEMLDDIEKTRISQVNRLSSGTVSEFDYKQILGHIKTSEQELKKLLQKQYKAVAPKAVINWQENTLGVGAPLLSRLLGHLGDPLRAQPKHWVDLKSTPGSKELPKKGLEDGEPFNRTVGQLWQYCGHGKAARRQKGMSQQDALALGNPRCKSLVHLIADGVVKAQVRNQDDGTKMALGEEAEFYLAEKEKYRESVHGAPCSGGYVSAGTGKVVFAKCKHDGHYAEAGDPYSPGHIDAIAKRHLGKELLKGLWLAAASEPRS